MPEPPPQPHPEPPTRRRLLMIDLAALVVGYGMAALLVRAFLPSTGLPGATYGAAVALEYLWLGLAMSGPIVLLFDPRTRPSRRDRPNERPRRLRMADFAASPRWEAMGLDRDRAGRPRPRASETSARYTRAELAWLAVGSYWIVMTMLLVPFRLGESPLVLMGVLQLLAATVLWVPALRGQAPAAYAVSWTHRAGVVLLVTWPLAWIGLILLSRG